MSVRIGDLLDTAYRYVKTKVQKARSGFDDAPDPVKQYRLSAEPPSAMFTEGATVTVGGIENPRDPLEATVTCEVKGVWRPEAKQMIEWLKSHNVKLMDIVRTGGVYQSTQANKKIRKQDKFFNFLLQVGLDFWRCPEWEDDAKEKTIALMEAYKERDQRNALMLKQDASSLIVGKPPKTGTGYSYPFDTRQGLMENFEKAFAMLTDTCSEFMDNLIEAIRHWPEKGATITIGGAWKGVEGGRSDADVLQWDGADDEHQVISSMTRDVGTVPSSPLHNRPLDPPSFMMELWQRFLTPFHILPMDIEGPALALTTPPATMKGDDPEEMVMISADFGATGNPVKYDGQRLIVPSEKIALGADNMTLFGINLYSITSNKYFGMLVSGAPFTMIIYLTTVGWVIASWALRTGISQSDLRIWQIGDDLQIMIRRKHIPALLARFGPWLRCKGMKVTDAGHMYFVTGKYVVWKDRKNIIAFMAPRILKSVTSASQTKDNAMVPDSVQVGDVIDMYFDDEDLEADIVKYWNEYRWTIMFEGTPEEYYNLWTTQGEEALAQQAALDPGSYFADFFTEQQDAMRRMRENMDKPGTPLDEEVDNGETLDDAASRQDHADAVRDTVEAGLADTADPSAEGVDATTAESEAEKGDEDSEDSVEDEDSESKDDSDTDEGKEPEDTEEAMSSDTSDDGAPKLSRPFKMQIYGGPTTGKTTLAKKLKAAGFKVSESDDFKEEVIKELMDEGIIDDPFPWRHYGTPGEEAYQQRMRAAVASHLETGDVSDFFFINMPSFYKGLEVRPHIAAIRKNTKRITQLSEERGGTPIPEDVAAEWFTPQKVQDIRKLFSNLVELEDDEYIDTLVLDYLEENGVEVDDLR